jgi:amino acid transporter
MSERLVFVRKASGLVRELSAVDVFLWAMGTPIASGVMFYAFNLVDKYRGASPLLSFVIGGILFTPIAVCLGMVARALPRSGGMYVAISRLVDPFFACVLGTMYALRMGFLAAVLNWAGTSVVGSTLALIGRAGAGEAWVRAGQWISTMPGQPIVALLLLLAFWGVALASLRAIKHIYRVILFLSLAGLFVLLIGAAVTPDPQQAWDRTWGAGTFQQVLDAASAHGWKPWPFSASATVDMLLAVILAYCGLEYITMVAGEVKDARRTMYRGLVAGYAGTVVIYLLVAWLSWRPYAATQFISAYAFLHDRHPEVLKSIMPLTAPSGPLFLGSLAPNIWLGAVAMVTMCLLFYKTALPALVSGSRVLFAMAFDRQLPPSFAAVNRRGVPTTATHAMGVSGLIMVGLYTVGGAQVAVAMLAVGTVLFYWGFGLAATVLPFKRPDIYALSPGQAQFLGIPTISWAGGLMMVVSWFLVALSLKAMTPVAVMLYCGLVLVLVIVWLRQQQANLDAGVELSAVYSEIPPE